MATYAPRRRLVKCELHSLHYDPELTQGCVRCRKEGRLATPKPKPVFLPMLLTLLALTLVIAHLAGALFAPEEELGEIATLDQVDATAPTPDTAIQRQDPAAHRRTIEAFERAMFGATTGTLDILFSDLEGGANAIANSLRRAGAQASADRMAAFADTLRTDQPSAARLQGARNRWLQLRGSMFGSAPWLRGGTSPTATDATTLALLRNAAETALDQARGARAAVEAGTEDAWQDWVTQAQAELDSAIQSVPSRAANPRDTELVVAQRDLRRALGTLRGFAQRPTAGDGLGERLADLTAQIDEARQVIADATSR